MLVPQVGGRSTSGVSGTAVHTRGEVSMPDYKHYQTAKHRAWREKVLRRAKYRCERCRRYGRTEQATHAHHKKSLEEYPELAYDVDNGEALCGRCHNIVEPRTLCRKR